MDPNYEYFLYCYQEANFQTKILLMPINLMNDDTLNEMDTLVNYSNNGIILGRLKTISSTMWTCIDPIDIKDILRRFDGLADGEIITKIENGICHIIPLWEDIKDSTDPNNRIPLYIQKSILEREGFDPYKVFEKYKNKQGVKYSVLHTYKIKTSGGHLKDNIID